MHQTSPAQLFRVGNFGPDGDDSSGTLDHERNETGDVHFLTDSRTRNQQSGQSGQQFPTLHAASSRQMKKTYPDRHIRYRNCPLSLQEIVSFPALQ